VQTLLANASKMHNKEARPFTKKLKEADEDTQVKLKYVKM
jgi:hypothetical protein